MAVDHVRINRPVIFPDTPQARTTIDAALSRAAREASELFPEVFFVSYAGDPTERSGNGAASAPRTAPPAFTVDVLANNVEDGRALILTMTDAAAGTAGQPQNFFGRWGEHLSRDVAHSIRYQYSSLQGLATMSPGEGPVFLDELSGSMISTADLGYAASVYPSSVAVAANGNLLIGTSVAAVELDPLYREVGKPGRELFTTDRISYAYNVSVTAAGTIFARTATGGQIFVIRPGFDRHQRLRSTVDTPAVSLPLSDGSYVMIDATSRRAVRLDGRREHVLDLFPTEYSYVFAAAAGPEGTLWTWDVMTGAILIYTAEGVRVDTIVPLLRSEDRGGVRALQTLPDGDFLVLAVDALYRFDRRGVPLWRLGGLPPPLGGNFAMIQSMAVDPDRGYIYLANISAQKVYRLVDLENRMVPSELDDRILAGNRVLAADPTNFDAYLDRARAYTDHGALSLAVEAWRNVLDIDPFDASAEAALTRVEGLFLAGQARQGRDRTLEILEHLGPESARATFSVTVQFYEQALARLAGHGDLRDGVRAEVTALRRAFEEYSSPRQDQRPLGLDVAGFTDLFPALIQYYQDNPVGTLTVTNTLDEAIYDVRATVAFRFLDFPQSSPPVRAIEPGESVAIPIPLVLSTDVLGLEEETPVAARFQVNYQLGGREETSAITRTVRVRRNTALYWDDSGKLASFITPNDDLVARFALDLVGQGPDASGFLPQRVWRAARIVDALGAYGIRYIEDPNSPFTEVFGSTGVLDTVRFPRTTLRVRTGDCDDTASLLASLLEATGIATAIMTSPGHVFIAFDTGEPATNRWLYEGSGRTIIVHDGTVWIPLETTILQEGFLRSWREASRLVTAYGEGVEFLPVRQQHEVYRPMPLAPATFDVVAPSLAVVEAVHGRTRTAVTDVLYHQVLAGLADQLASAAGRDAARTSNQIGVLHARFGDVDAALRTFQQVVAGSPGFAPAQVNLANVLYLQGEYHRALAAAQRAADLRPRSAAVHLVLIQAAEAAGETARARVALEDLRSIDNHQALRFSYLLGPEGGGGENPSGVRASAVDQPTVFAWESGQ